MARKKEDPFFNYLLTMGFVLLLLMFLFSLIVMSRVVLSDVNPITDHVATTQELLEEVAIAEKLKKWEQFNGSYDRNLIFKKVPREAITFTNFGNASAIVTLRFSASVVSFGDYIYVKGVNISQLDQGDLIVHGNETVAYFLDSVGKNAIIYDKEAGILKGININNITGVVISEWS